MNRESIRAAIEFRKAALEEARTAYLELLSGRAQQYTIGNRQLTRFDLAKLKKEISDLENEITGLENQLAGGRKMRAVAAVANDW